MKFRVPMRFIAVLAAVSVPSLALAAPSPAKPDPANPWQYDNWPQTQPWQESAPPAKLANPATGPIDPQNWVNPDQMTWNDYKKPPGTNWADPTKTGSVRTFKGALVVVDYPNQPFVITQPKHSTPFGNPSAEANGIPRDQVAELLPRLPQHARRTQPRPHDPRVLDGGLRRPVRRQLTAFGAYQLPGKSYEYGMEFQGNTACPAGDNCTRNIRTDARAAWVADQAPKYRPGSTSSTTSAPGRTSRPPGRSSGR